MCVYMLRHALLLHGNEGYAAAGRDDAQIEMLRAGCVARGPLLLSIANMGNSAHPVPRADALHLVCELVQRAARLQLTGTAAIEPPAAMAEQPALLESVLGLSRYNPVVKLPPGVVPPPMAVTQLYWKAWVTLTILGCCNPGTLGAAGWGAHPTLRTMMEMCLTGREQSLGSTVGSATAAEERQRAVLERDVLLGFEEHLATAAGAPPPTAATSKLLGRYCQFASADPARAMPPTTAAELRRVAEQLGLGQALCSTREPDYLLQVMAVSGPGDWLDPLVARVPRTLEVLPVAAVVGLYLQGHRRAEFVADQARHAAYRDRLRAEVHASATPIHLLLDQMSSTDAVGSRAANLGLRELLAPATGGEGEGADWLSRGLTALPYFAEVQNKAGAAAMNALLAGSDASSTTALLHFLCQHAPSELVPAVLQAIGALLDGRTMLRPLLLRGNCGAAVLAFFRANLVPSACAFAKGADDGGTLLLQGEHRWVPHQLLRALLYVAVLGATVEPDGCPLLRAVADNSEAVVPAVRRSAELWCALVRSRHPGLEAVAHSAATPELLLASISGFGAGIGMLPMLCDQLHQLVGGNTARITEALQRLPAAHATRLHGRIAAPALATRPSASWLRDALGVAGAAGPTNEMSDGLGGGGRMLASRPGRNPRPGVLGGLVSACVTMAASSSGGGAEAEAATKAAVKAAAKPGRDGTHWPAVVRAAALLERLGTRGTPLTAVQSALRAAAERGAAVPPTALCGAGGEGVVGETPPRSLPAAAPPHEMARLRLALGPRAVAAGSAAAAAAAVGGLKEAVAAQSRPLLEPLLLSLYRTASTEPASASAFADSVATLLGATQASAAGLMMDWARLVDPDLERAGVAGVGGVVFARSTCRALRRHLLMGCSAARVMAELREQFGREAQPMPAADAAALELAAAAQDHPHFWLGGREGNKGRSTLVLPVGMAAQMARRAVSSAEVSGASADAVAVWAPAVLQAVPSAPALSLVARKLLATGGVSAARDALLVRLYLSRPSLGSELAGLHRTTAAASGAAGALDLDLNRLGTAMLEAYPEEAPEPMALQGERAETAHQLLRIACVRHTARTARYLPTLCGMLAGMPGLGPTAFCDGGHHVAFERALDLLEALLPHIYALPDTCGPSSCIP